MKAIAKLAVGIFWMILMGLPVMGRELPLQLLGHGGPIKAISVSPAVSVS